MTKKFLNPHILTTKRNFFHFLLWCVGYYKDPQPVKPIPQDFSYPNPCEVVNVNQPQVTWVNHSTFWVQAYGKSILTDPIWNKRCSPLPFLGPKRKLTARPACESIQHLDYVIISHNHYDHLDKPTILQLVHEHPACVWIVPKGIKKWFIRVFSIPSKQVIELDWWENFYAEGLIFTATPAQHFSGRGLFDHDHTLWMGCVIEFQNRKRLYFAGDTGYNDHDFKTIGQKFGGMDLSLLPIGAYAPRKFMQPVHVNPQEAVLIHQEVGSKLSVGGHWGTFRLSNEGLERPPYDLYCALKKADVGTNTFRILNPGQTINW